MVFCLFFERVVRQRRLPRKLQQNSETRIFLGSCLTRSRRAIPTEIMNTTILLKLRSPSYARHVLVEASSRSGRSLLVEESIGLAATIASPVGKKRFHLDDAAFQ